MRKYKFLFLTLILGFFFFLPDDVFALEIQAYDSSGNLAYKSNASLPEVAQDCSFVGDIKGFTIFFHDQYDFYTNYNYEIKVDVILYSKVQNGVVDLGNPVFCAGGSCPPLNITSYSYGPWKGPTDAFCGVGGYTEPVKYSATFTTTINGSRGYISWNFLHPITGLQAIVLNDYEITNLSDGTGAIINNSANSIIKNNKENTDRVIDNQNKNQQQTNERLDSINNFLEDDSVPESDISSLGNVQGLLPPGPVDSLLNIPFKFLSIIVSSLGDLCVPLSFNWVFNESLTLPCFSDSFYNNVPDYLMIFINLIPAGFILISYLKHLYKKVNRAVSLESTADDEWGVL